MFKLVYSLLLARKKWFLLIVCSLALMLAATLSILTASETIKANLRDDAYIKYGEHSGVLLNADASKEELKRKVDEIGSFLITDTLQLQNEKVVTVGWFDNKAIELGNLQLIEGHFPKSHNEVVIESSYKKLLEKEQSEWKVGESRILNLESGSKELKLSGVIRDYSSNWSVPAGVEKGINDFPNIFTNVSQPTSNNYIFKIDGNKEESINNSTELIKEYGDGFINARLFYTGLIDYDTVSMLSGIFQIVVLLTSIISLVTILSFYNLKIRKKLAIFKVVGANNKKLFSILVIQYLLMLAMSLLPAIPIAIALTRLIILNTYNNGLVGALNWSYIAGSTFLILFIAGLFLIAKSIYDIRTLQSNSLTSILRDTNEDRNINIKTERFLFKQLHLQLTTYKRLSILTTLSLTFTILVITMSIFTQKETSGIWDGEVDYFISSQEIYLHKVVDNLTVLKEDGLTITEADVKKIEALPFVHNIEKKPFMIDVHPIIEDEMVTQSIKEWITLNNATQSKYKNNAIVPNVNYQIVDSREFQNLIPNGSYEEFKGQALLLLPKSNSSNAQLIHQELKFIRLYNDGNKLSTQEWKYPIYDVIDHEAIEGITIVLDKETAIRNGIFRGYHELAIMTADNLSVTQKGELEAILSEIVSTTPGSLYQIVSDFMMDDTKISVMFGFLGKISFVIAIILALISTLIMVFGKYKIQRIYWGTYMAMGMRKIQVVQYLGLEMLVYLGLGAALSGLLFIIAATYLGHLYPLYDYLIQHLFAVLFILILLGIGIYLIKKQVSKHSIYYLLRREE